MTTYAQLVGRVRQELLGPALHQESVGQLDAAIAASDTSFTVDMSTAENLSRGLVEIGDELILVRDVDPSSGLVTVMGGVNGRGAEGTTPAAHAADDLVTCAPTFPRARIKQTINETILGFYPKLRIYASTDITFNAAQVEYELPADTTEVIYLTARTTGPTMVSFPAPNWRYNPRAWTSDFASGRSLQILDPVTPGQNVHVVYSRAPATLAADADDFATVSGYPDRLTDLVVWGAALRMLAPLDAARLQIQAVEASDRSQAVPVNSASKAVQLLSALYERRLAEEVERQFAEIPPYATFQGS